MGDEVTVLTGAGSSSARGAVVAAHTVRLELLDHSPAPEAGVALTLVRTILKGDRMDDVVRDATMMGGAAIAR